jgi:hypothetical protein
MSRGPGKWQRAILAAIDAEPGGVLVWTIAGIPDRSKQEAARRAATTLEKQGKAKTCTVWTDTEIGTRHMLSVMAPEANLPPFRSKTGMRGWDL